MLDDMQLYLERLSSANPVKQLLENLEFNLYHSLG